MCSCPGLNKHRLRVFYSKTTKVTKAIFARLIFVVYCFVAVWRVTRALNNELYWLLLSTLSPLAIEMMYTFAKRKTTQLKWVTPSMFFYLFCSIPCIWLLELKLLCIRVAEGAEEHNTTFDHETACLIKIEANATNASVFIDQVFTIDATDEEWTLALEQILIFALVLVKWIAPKDQGVTEDQRSQLLLVNIAAGADILELMEAFNEEKVKTNKVIVYMIMGVWTWSLLQFSVVLTAMKATPTLEDDNPDFVLLPQQKHNEKKMATTLSTTVEEEENQPDSSLTLNQSKDSATVSSPNASTVVTFKESVDEKENEKTSNTNYNKQINNEPSSDTMTSTTKNQVPTNLITAVENSSSNQHKQQQGCLNCFVFYNEVWAIALSLLFQDIPFFIVRMIILLYYHIITQSNIFFTAKNILVICLLLNRIKVIIFRERRPWVQHMRQVREQQRLLKQPLSHETINSNGQLKSDNFSQIQKKNRSTWRSMMR